MEEVPPSQAAHPCCWEGVILPRCGAFELGGWEGKGLLTWLGGSGQFCLGALLGGLQQDLPHLQTDRDVSLPKHCPDPPLPPHTRDLCRTQRSRDILTGASPVTLPHPCCSLHRNIPSQFVPLCHTPSGSESGPGTCGSGAACALPANAPVWRAWSWCCALQPGLAPLDPWPAPAPQGRCLCRYWPLTRIGSWAHRSHTKHLPLSGKGGMSQALTLCLAPPSTGQPELWGGKQEGQCLTSFKEQFGEGGGAQASSQVQGGVPGESPAVDVCSQLRKV